MPFTPSSGGKRHQREGGWPARVSSHVNDTAYVTVSPFLRKNIRTWKVVVAAVVVLSGLGLAFAARAGVWGWRDFFRHRGTYVGEQFSAETACRQVRTGSEASCGGPWAYPCFDHGRCSRGLRGDSDEGTGAGSGGDSSGGGGGPLLSVYIHDEICSMKTSSEILARQRADEMRLYEQAEVAMRDIASERAILVETPDEACIIFYVVHGNDAECVSKSRTWTRGQNHVLLDFSGQSREKRQSMDMKAMFAESNMRPCYFRYGYDIAVPLPPKKLFPGLRELAPLDRNFFATFKAHTDRLLTNYTIESTATHQANKQRLGTVKGTLYLSGSGTLERSAVLNLRGSPDSHRVIVNIDASNSNGDDNRGSDGGGSGSDDATSGALPFRDVVVVERCQTLHKEHLLSSNKQMCESLQQEYDETDYADLMNTTFALVPAGRSPATFRLGETMSAGAIPVFIHNNFVKPYPEKIPWSEFSFTFPVEEVPQMMEVLRAVPEARLRQMQEIALGVYDKYFAQGMPDIVHTVFDILEDRLAFQT